MQKKGIDVLIVSNPKSINKLTGLKVKGTGIKGISEPGALFLLVNTTKNVVLCSKNPKLDGWMFSELPTNLDGVLLSSAIKKLVFKSENLAFEEDSFLYKDLKCIKSQLRCKSTDASGLVEETLK